MPALLRPARIVGTAFIGCALLSYEILTTRLLGMVLGDHVVILAVAYAMLGTGAAASVMSTRSERTFAGPAWLGILALLLGLSSIIVLLVLTLLSAGTNAALNAAIRSGGLYGVVMTIRATLQSQLFLTGLLMAAPYAVFGVLITVLFRTAPARDYNRLYAADLTGAAFGCVAAIIAFTAVGYRGGVGLVLVSAVCAAMAFSLGRSVVMLAISGVAAALVGFVLSSTAIVSAIEPQPSMDLLARNYNGQWSATESWHRWNAQTRMARIHSWNRKTGQTHDAYALENGEGWALAETGGSVQRLVTMLHPKRVLVLFAGVGSDMLAIDKYCGGACEITGVEINRQMVDHALDGDFSALNKLLAKPGISLRIAEGREFLERDKTRYDAILLSWWGAGTSYYVGTTGRLAQYMYTKEAFETLRDHLTARGTVVIFNGSKAQTLATLRSVYSDRGMSGFANDVVIVQPAKSASQSGSLGFYDQLEQMRLVWKPSGFSPAEMKIVNATAAAIDYSPVLSPDGVAPRYGIYGALAHGAPLDQLNAELTKTRGIALNPVTDDRPFLNELTPRSFYLDPARWLGPAHNPLWQITRTLALSVLLLILAAAATAFGPLLRKSGPQLSKDNLVRMGYFAILGSGFMFIEIGYINKLGIVLGHPSYSIAIVLAALVFSTGIGSLCSQRIVAGGLLSEKMIAALIVVYAGAGAVLYNMIWKDLIALELVYKAIAVAAFLFPLGFLMGQLFPQALAEAGKQDGRLVPWAWAVNSVSSTVAVSVGYILSDPLGFNALICMGALLYGAILLLPLRREARAADSGASYATGAALHDVP